MRNIKSYFIFTLKWVISIYNTEFSSLTFSKSVDEFRGAPYNLNEYSAIIQTLKDFEKLFEIYWSERL